MALTRLIEYLSFKTAVTRVYTNFSVVQDKETGFIKLPFASRAVFLFPETYISKLATQLFDRLVKKINRLVQKETLKTARKLVLTRPDMNDCYFLLSGQNGLELLRDEDKGAVVLYGYSQKSVDSFARTLGLPLEARAQEAEKPEARVGKKSPLEA